MHKHLTVLAPPHSTLSSYFLSSPFLSHPFKHILSLQTLLHFPGFLLVSFAPAFSCFSSLFPYSFFLDVWKCWSCWQMFQQVKRPIFLFLSNSISRAKTSFIYTSDLYARRVDKLFTNPATTSLLFPFLFLFYFGILWHICFPSLKDSKLSSCTYLLFFFTPFFVFKYQSFLTIFRPVPTCLRHWQMFQQMKSVLPPSFSNSVSRLQISYSLQVISSFGTCTLCKKSLGISLNFLALYFLCYYDKHFLFLGHALGDASFSSDVIF